MSSVSQGDYFTSLQIVLLLLPASEDLKLLSITILLSCSTRKSSKFPSRRLLLEKISSQFLSGGDRVCLSFQRKIRWGARVKIIKKQDLLPKKKIFIVLKKCFEFQSWQWRKIILWKTFWSIKRSYEAVVVIFVGARGRLLSRDRQQRSLWRCCARKCHDAER